MLQNRVDPFGNIIKTSARGNWMGNRGILHDDGQNVLRRWKLKAWLTCVLEFNGRKREVMSPHRYTELFFWDEATAFAAGHRPCFECRRNDFNRFKATWLEGNPEYGFDKNVSVTEIDKIIHRERITRDGSKVTYEADLRILPDGCFIEFNGRPCLVLKGHLFPWSPSGYAEGEPFSDAGQVKVLTPKSIVNAVRACYSPQVIMG